ncbi:hypothetical protein AMJ80_01355 [bacterium SM23_31]|nr:MAG: hypothetical protein AMJ80_01355 [bacterium SM23_31]
MADNYFPMSLFRRRQIRLRQTIILYLMQTKTRINQNYINIIKFSQFKIKIICNYQYLTIFFI